MLPHARLLPMGLGRHGMLPHTGLRRLRLRRHGGTRRRTLIGSWTPGPSPWLGVSHARPGRSRPRCRCITGLLRHTTHTHWTRTGCRRPVPRCLRTWLGSARRSTKCTSCSTRWLLRRTRLGGTSLGRTGLGRTGRLGQLNLRQNEEISALMGRGHLRCTLGIRLQRRKLPHLVESDQHLRTDGDLEPARQGVLFTKAHKLSSRATTQFSAQGKRAGAVSQLRQSCN